MKSTRQTSITLGRCVHCLDFCQNINRDHLFPQAWYPELTPENIDKPWFPSCVPCNWTHGQIEDRLRRALGLAVNPNNAAAAGIQESVLRAVDPSRARNERDAKHRAGARKKLLKQTLIVPKSRVNELNLLPNLDVDSKRLQSQYVTVGIVESADINAFGRKIARGIIYLKNLAFIEQNHEINLETADHLGLFEAAVKQGDVLERPGIVIEYKLVPAEDLQTGLFRVRIWDQLTLYVWSTPKSTPRWSG